MNIAFRWFCLVAASLLYALVFQPMLYALLFHLHDSAIDNNEWGIGRFASWNYNELSDEDAAGYSSNGDFVLVGLSFDGSNLLCKLLAHNQLVQGILKEGPRI